MIAGKLEYDLVAGLMTDEQEPITIRLSKEDRTGSASPASEYYLLVTGLYKLLAELNVIEYRHSLNDGDLVFYIEIRESRSVVRSYLQKLKKFHMLGPAWKFVIIEGSRMSVPVSDSVYDPDRAVNLDDLVNAHMSMGSRPLRFSRYFLYSALRPFSRKYGYGSCLAGREDSRGRLNFYQVLRGLDLLQKAFRAVDFSAISSAEEIANLLRPLAGALEEINSKPGFFIGLLYYSASLAWAYEQKMQLDEFPKAIMKFSTGLIKGMQRNTSSIAIERLLTIQEIISSGFQLIIDMMDEVSLDDLDNLTLELFSSFQDCSTMETAGLSSLLQLQKLAYFALEGQAVSRGELDRLFVDNGLLMDDVRDLIVVMQLIDCLSREE